ncbi:hypothetical protein TPASS_0656 [Treponema pallidum subsp. pallidum SS14]|uniref:Uncharacterized protein TP_0656 n=2 Tax=Treponema pallidum subsp. pallidum TaxID=161 RepID=Y656_TREPA|nr:RecName: Full=Uncharacterized protein TP_0656 [Treponema pallidum subsp. pallidum str. Nichols]AAC65639.1 predicted coding region TP0656 [Treponema pallidum subsp. pallidum str. Nichols]ACD71074.1 hypothetical protein TPASS_0656 [Treponema pallidum subsp. pallidum SS14]
MRTGTRCDLGELSHPRKTLPPRGMGILCNYTGN